MDDFTYYLLDYTLFFIYFILEKRRQVLVIFYLSSSKKKIPAIFFNVVRSCVVNTH